MEFSIRRWQVLYGHEYESLINHEAMIAVNPYYTEYLDVNQVPAFLQALPSETKPNAVILLHRSGITCRRSGASVLVFHL